MVPRRLGNPEQQPQVEPRYVWSVCSTLFYHRGDVCLSVSTRRGAHINFRNELFALSGERARVYVHVVSASWYLLCMVTWRHCRSHWCALMLHLKSTCLIVVMCLVCVGSNRRCATSYIVRQIGQRWHLVVRGERWRSTSDFWIVYFLNHSTCCLPSLPCQYFLGFRVVNQDVKQVFFL